MAKQSPEKTLGNPRTSSKTIINPSKKPPKNHQKFAKKTRRKATTGASDQLQLGSFKVGQLCGSLLEPQLVLLEKGGPWLTPCSGSFSIFFPKKVPNKGSLRL